MSGVVVCKFGGGPMSDAEHILRSAAIVRKNKNRKIVVVSAPGRRQSNDPKITDLLYLCQRVAVQGLSISPIFRTIADRFSDIVRGCDIRFSLQSHLEELRDAIQAGSSPEYAASRGEDLMARIMAEVLGYAFVDAAEVIHFGDDGKLQLDATQNSLRQKLSSLKGGVVIPGFYGSKPDGSIQTFSRGGSDITGSLVAEAVGAERYENWTNVSGVRTADPRVVSGAKRIKALTFAQLAELAYAGAEVFHPDAVAPVMRAHIPVYVLNADKPDDPGTVITAHEEGEDSRVVGVAGRIGFTVLTIFKSGMNEEVGFAARVFAILSLYGISWDHTPTSMDTMSVVIPTSQVTNTLPDLEEEIRVQCRPEGLIIEHGLALVVVVGHKVAHNPHIAASLFKSLAEAGVPVRLFSMGASELNIVVGVSEQHYEGAMRAIYQVFF